MERQRLTPTPNADSQPDSCPQEYERLTCFRFPFQTIALSLIVSFLLGLKVPSKRPTVANLMAPSAVSCQFIRSYVATASPFVSNFVVSPNSLVNSTCFM